MESGCIGDSEKKPMMIYKAQYMRLVVLLVFFTFCSFCALLSIFTLPDDLISSSDHLRDKNLNQELAQRTRMFQALIGESYSPESDVRNLGFKLKQILEKPASNSLRKANEVDYEDIVADESDDDDYDDLPENNVFAVGDFDYAATNATEIESFVMSVMKTRNRIESNVEVRNAQQMFRIKLVESINPIVESPDILQRNTRKYHVGKLRNVSMVNYEGVPIAEDKVYWSKDLEESTPKGVSDMDVSITQRRLRTQHVQRVQKPTWNLCGRPKNLFVVFEDGSKACARYRAPHQYLVKGEVLSFYLARLLGITNVPVVTLISSDVQDDRWSNEEVRKAVRASEWESNTSVALIQWIDGLERDKMPPLILSALMNKTTIYSHTAGLYDLSVTELVELLQWSDLIVFDYLTGNYDRVASMQDAADKEKKPSILNETIHNLVKSRSTKSLWLIDNESGLLDSYSLLYGQLGKDNRFLNFHKRMLNSICLFRRTTAESIRWLHQIANPGKALLEFVQENEPLFTGVEHMERLSTRLRERVGEVHDRIRRCMRDYPRVSD